MPHLSWTVQSLRDIQRLYRFLARHDIEAAKRAVRAIRRKAGMLAKYPEIGRPRGDMPRNVRELVIEFGNEGYLAIYRLEGEQVTVLAVRHQKEAGREAGE